MAKTATSWRAVHKSGTKFYEITVVGDGTNGIEIRRWGPVASLSGGGQTSLWGGPLSLCIDRRNAQQKAKTKGGYTEVPTTTPPNFDADLAHFSRGDIKTFEEFFNRVSVKTAYGTPKAAEMKAEVIAQYGASATDKLSVPPIDPPKPAAPAVSAETVASPEWGSW